ncbi:pirin family protein [Leptospira inadai serovar Lyme str. 10]|uniref:Pirin family protein n=2 Tax=Leptospira inadai serovar Lyme TaxID=293084 RepID=V6HDF9_9LEPT|nr:pirin family protein [Leptospira inadai]EQA37867.1 pirin family protein [Leptospira inadai serovar Lyme str. 10]PNV74672.1 pirin family protein [Leptospira inadai serovar Lyme]
MGFRRIIGTRMAEKTLEGGGFPVRRPFPVSGFSYWDPFLLLDEMGPIVYGPGEAIGAPDHPHRGFETVTYLLSGEMEHKDSWGHAGRLNAGGIQWMTAGAGLIHSELPSEEFRKKGGRMHGFQIWVNLPKERKLISPRYQEVNSEELPIVEKDGVWAKVIAGDLWGTSAVIQTQTPIVFFHLKLSPGSWAEIQIPNGFTALAYPFVGSGTVIDSEAETEVEEGETIYYGNEMGAIALRAPQDFEWEVLILGGVPIQEPVARYGPFVMNTSTEIQEAFEDYSAGKMGEIPAQD